MAPFIPGVLTMRSFERNLSNQRLFNVAVMYVIYRTYTSVMTSAFQRMIPVPFPESGTVFTTPATAVQALAGTLAADSRL